jgi:hypothetical protein
VWRRALFFLCGVSLCGLVSPSLRALEPLTDASTRARELFGSGLKHLQLGEAAEACSYFESSVALEGTPDRWLEVGKCREPRDPLGAIRSFEAVLAGARQVSDRPRRAAIEKVAHEHLDALAPRVAALTFQPSPTPGVSVDITRVDATRAEIARSGEPKSEPVSVYGDPVRFNPGKYRVRAWAAGSFSYLLQVELRAGEARELVLPALQPLPVGAAGAAASAAGRPAARSASSVGRSAATPTHPPPRSAPVTELPRSARVSAPPEGVAAAVDQKHRSGSVALPWTLIGGGAALVVAGVVAGQFSSGARHDLEGECGPPDPVTKRRSCPNGSGVTKRRMENYAIAADVLWVSGALLAGTGITLLLVRHEREPEASVSLGCFDGGCGLSSAGRF